MSERKTRYNERLWSSSTILRFLKRFYGKNVNL